MIKVFVIILNWDGYQDTIECLKLVSRLRVTGYELRVIVVDNGSTDSSVAQIKNLDLKTKNYKLKIIENKENLGFAEGNNVGMRYALKNGADYILVLNNDTLVDRDLIVQLVKAAKKHPNAGALTSKIYFAKGFEFHQKRYKKKDFGKVIWSVGGQIDWDNVYGQNRGVDEVDRGQYDKIGAVDFATGAAAFYDAKALKKVGLFDERYFMYFEDVDLSMRMKKCGFRVLYVPNAKVWHKVAQSSGIGSDLNDYFITRNRLLFGMRYAPVRAKFALIRESFMFPAIGRKWQVQGAMDFYLRRFGKGSWKK